MNDRRAIPLRCRPFKQFGPIKPILLVHPVGWQLALLAPGVNRFSGNPEPSSRFAYIQIHNAAEAYFSQIEHLWSSAEG